MGFYQGKISMLKNILFAAGWILAIVLGGVLYVELQTIGALKAKVESAQATYESVKASAARVASLEEKCAALEATVATLSEAAKKGMETAAAVRDKMDVPEGFDAAALVKNMFGGDGTAEESAGDGGKNSKNPFAAMFEGEEGEKLMESMLPAQIDMQYGELFNMLGLTDERKAALRDLILEHARAGSAAAMAMMRGESSPDEMEMPSDDGLRAAVGELLTPAELEQFNAYQEALPEKMMRQQFEMQIGMMAGDLPEEVRNLTVDVLVENLLTAQPEGMTSMPDFDAMRAAFDNTIVTLEQEQELEPEYLDRVRGLIQQQRAGIDMAARMLGDAASEETAP